MWGGVPDGIQVDAPGGSGVMPLRGYRVTSLSGYEATPFAAIALRVKNGTPNATNILCVRTG